MYPQGYGVAVPPHEATMMRYRILILLALASMAAPAASQPYYDGTVYGVYPEGVMINQGGGSILVPTEHASFSIGGVSASWSKLQPGQVVHAVMPEPYLPSIVRVPDPYAWKMKYHPNHPHGGPPGQMKKMRGQRGNAKGRGKGKGW